MNQEVGLKSKYPKRPNIKRLRKFALLTKEYLGCPVQTSADHLVRFLCLNGSAKIGDFKDPFGINNVLGLDVSMDHFLVVNGVDAV
jgi:hypothetical protein